MSFVTRWQKDKGAGLTCLSRRDPDFIPPRKPYSFLAMLDDILQFSAQTLVDGGRLSFWMPTANDENQEIAVPTHPYLEVVSVCTQVFNKCMLPATLGCFWFPHSDSR